MPTQVPLYALFNASDHYHARAQSDLARLELDHLAIVVPYPVYLESYSLVLYHLSFEYAQTFARELTQGVNFINPIPNDYSAATQRTARFPDQRITLCDAVLANRLNLPVWTYDYHFDVMEVLVWRQ